MSEKIVMIVKQNAAMRDRILRVQFNIIRPSACVDRTHLIDT